ncbi:TcdA/TcdB pore-forming domain-containing protein [Pseudomonas sp. PCH446]
MAAGSALLVLASLGLDSYLLAHARTAEDKAVYGSNVGLDSLALGTVLAGFAEGAEFLGPLSIPLAGLGLGVSSLVSVFFAKAHKVLATGEHFTREIQAYRSGYIEDPETHILQLSGPVIVTHLDQRNGQVYLGSPKIYAVDNSHSGDPQVIVDERQAIDVGQVLELPRQMALPASDTARALYLPATPEHSYLPQYAWLVGATQRNDAQLQLFKVLEQKTQGRFIEAEWVAVFQKVAEKLLPRYHPTRIRVSLGLEAPPLVMDTLGELGQYLSYDIEGQGSQYDLYLNEGARLNLSSRATSQPSTWVLHSDHLSRPEDIRLEAGRLTIGGVVVQVEDKASVYVVNRANEAYRLDLAAGRYTLVTLGAGITRTSARWCSTCKHCRVDNDWTPRCTSKTCRPPITRAAVFTIDPPTAVSWPFPWTAKITARSFTRSRCHGKHWSSSPARSARRSRKPPRPWRP